MQTAYQMNDIDHVDILIKLVFEISFEKVEKSDIEKPNFQGGAKNSMNSLRLLRACLRALPFVI